MYIAMHVRSGRCYSRKSRQILVQKLASITKTMDKFKELGHVLGNRIQESKDQMFIGSFQEIHDLHKELLPYRAILENKP